MDNAAKTFESLVNRAEESISRSVDDYINPDDGLLWCGKCHTPKQCRVTAFGKDYTPYCACKCERERFETEREAFIQRQREAELKMLRTSSCLTGKLAECRFEDYSVTSDNDMAYGICKKYADNFDTMFSQNQGLLLWGSMGSGKTFSAACIANALLNKGVGVVMDSFANLLGEAKGIGGETVGRLNRAKLLIIDDLGAERNTDFALEKVYSVIDSRYRSGLPMILTTNLSLAEMQSTTDLRYARIYERILEVCYPVQFNGRSFRRGKAVGRFNEMKKFFMEGCN